MVEKPDNYCMGNEKHQNKDRQHNLKKDFEEGFDTTAGLLELEGEVGCSWVQEGGVEGNWRGLERK